MTDELKGKSALVTGASRGIGEAIARELADAGVAVMLTARSEGDIARIAQEIRDSGGRAEATGCDVSQWKDVKRAVEACCEAFGKIDILVNNAGLIEPVARIAESDPDAWGLVADVNYKGVYYGMRAAIPSMLAQGGGTVLTISSGAAVSALEGWSHYCSSKAAALSLTRCAHKEYGEQGIHVVGLSPGTVATDMQVAIRASGVNPVSQLDPSVHIPPEWAAKAAVWLCTSSAADIAGEDFALREEANRQRVGLPAR